MRPPDAAIRQTMRPAEWGLLLFLAVVWGGSFFFSRIAVGELPPLTVVLARVALAALALNVVLLMTGRSVPGDRRAWGAFLAMGLLNNVIPFGLIFWGQTQIASGLASILNATTPLFTVLAAHVATTDEKIATPRLVGVVAGLAGVAVMIGPGALVDRWASAAAGGGAGPAEARTREVGEPGSGEGFLSACGRRARQAAPLRTGGARRWSSMA